MKDLLALFAFTALITTFSAMAKADDITILNQSQQTLAVKVYEIVGGKQIEKNTACLPPFTTSYFADYKSEQLYKITRGAVRMDCDETPTDERELDFKMFKGMDSIVLENNGAIIIRE